MATRVPKSPPPAPATVLLRQREGPDVELRLPEGFAQLAMKWSYIARSRDRWRTSGSDPAEGSGNPLAGLLTDEQLQRLAEHPVVEVHLSADPADEARGWAERVFPWEYALSALTRGRRRKPLLLLRVLSLPAAAPGRTAVDLARPGVVQSAPQGLDQWYEVKAEGEVMLTALGADSARTPRLDNPTREALGGWRAEHTPTLLHLAGVDNHQAHALLRLDEPEVLDGMVLARPDGSADAVPAEDLARLLAQGPNPPQLVMLNAYNTASRLAARVVAHGAPFAIGYHDTIDDALAAQFCVGFYTALREHQGEVLPAFERAMAQVRAQPQLLRGACIVLWSASSLLRPAAARAGTRAAARKAATAGTAPRQLAELAEDERPLRVSCDPLARINYSLLHNKKSLLRSLKIMRNNVAGELRDIELRVTLNTGDTEVPYATLFTLPADQAMVDLAPRVVVPLASALLRRQSERVQSILTVEVLWGKKRCFLETYRVGLCPVDEWQDGEVAEWAWLPSFVLPRDAAVARVVDSAQALLATLADDPGAGFDGYQSIDMSSTDLEARYAAVDRQVQALWHALLHHHPLSYINPPPSYGSATQRVRTPSQVVGERRGTCIDLALLLASCLEYVDIYPVLFLLTGHCFVGYWRGSDLHDAFAVKGVDIKGLDDAANPGGAAQTSGTAGVVQVPHVLDQGQWLEVRQHVMEGRIVPLEATWLCQRGGMAGAAQEGRHNLRSKRDFCAMVDVKLARDGDVTPLPMLGDAS